MPLKMSSSAKDLETKNLDLHFRLAKLETLIKD